MTECQSESILRLSLETCAYQQAKKLIKDMETACIYGIDYAGFATSISSIPKIANEVITTLCEEGVITVQFNDKTPFIYLKDSQLVSKGQVINTLDRLSQVEQRFII